jgi:hypothetical protein
MVQQVFRHEELGDRSQSGPFGRLRFNFIRSQYIDQISQSSNQVILYGGGCGAVMAAANAMIVCWGESYDSSGERSRQQSKRPVINRCSAYLVAAQSFVQIIRMDDSTVFGELYGSTVVRHCLLRFVYSSFVLLSELVLLSAGRASLFAIEHDGGGGDER